MGLNPELCDPCGLPAPSPELILILALVQAHLASLSKRDRLRFLQSVTRALGTQEASYNVLRFRPRSEDKAVYAAMRGAQAWFKQALGVLTRME